MTFPRPHAPAGALSTLLAALALTACTHTGGTDAAATVRAPQAQRPNILLILADDLGYSDLGAFGGEIPTPNLDALAAQSRLLTSHYVAPTCSPTRAMLMSGTDNHQAGLGSMGELVGAAPPLQGKPGYEGYLHERVLWLPQLLRDGGYHTYMAGKWHLSRGTESSWPAARGFEASFALLPGAGHHFAQLPGRAVPGDAGPYVEDDRRSQLPEGAYSSQFFTDKLLSYLQRSQGDGKPFFAYLAFTAPHWPLQAPDEDIAKFAGRYDAGYEAIRAQRFAKQKALGLVPADFKLATLPASKEYPTWAQLTPGERQSEARKMEVYAAMVHHMDRQVGRVVEHLKRTGQYENTLIVFQSDNGSEPSPSFMPSTPRNDNSLANMGRRFSNIAYGPRWAEVSATPLRYFKGYTGEGGVTAPAFVRLPRQSAALPPLREATHVTDVAPTLLDAAGIPVPVGRYAGREVLPMTGASLLPALAQPSSSPLLARRIVAGELFAGRYVRDAQWKLVSIREPFSDNRWQLYDMANDRGETIDLAAQRPEVVKQLAGEWDAYARRVGVVMFESKMTNVHYGATDPGLPRPGTP